MTENPTPLERAERLCDPKRFFADYLHEHPEAIAAEIQAAVEAAFRNGCFVCRNSGRSSNGRSLICVVCSKDSVSEAVDEALERAVEEIRVTCGHREMETCDYCVSAMAVVLSFKSTAKQEAKHCVIAQHGDTPYTGTDVVAEKEKKHD